MDDGKESFMVAASASTVIVERCLLLYTSQQLTWLNTVAEFTDRHGNKAVNCIQPETPVI